jgi:signal transduction histidine kinase
LASNLHSIQVVSDIEIAFADPDRYPFVMTADRNVRPERQRLGAALVGILLIVLAALTALIPASNVSAHNILHHLNFLPLMIAGILFGWNGALITALIAAALNAPNIARDWRHWPLDAKDQIVELAIFSLAGLIAGYLSDRERAHRIRLEKTQQELQQVYLELRENIAEMKKAERLSAAGQLAASLAHEIRNPLASISGAAGIIQRGSAPPEYLQDSLEIIQKESQRLNKLLTGSLNFATPRSPRLQPTNINELLNSVVSLASHSAQTQNVVISYPNHLPEPEVACDPEQLKQVLLNLLINAVEVSPAHSEVRITAMKDAKRMTIEVEDHGSGISSDAADRIFDPFFTTKPNGSGLGLAISSMIVRQHNGALSFHPNQHGGTTFRIELPIQPEQVHAE